MDHSYKVTLQNRLTGVRHTYQVRGETGRDAMREAFRTLRFAIEHGDLERGSYGDYHVDRVETAAGSSITNLL